MDRNEFLAELHVDIENIVLEEGYFISKENERNEYVYVIESGFCSFYRDNHISGFLSDGDMIGIFDILDGEKSTMTIQTLTTVTALRFPKTGAIARMINTPQKSYYFYSRLQRYQQQFIDKSIILTLSANERLTKCLNLIANTHGKSVGRAIMLPKVFTIDIIADYAEIQSERMHYLYKKMIQTGRIKNLDGQLFIIIDN
ncbi:Crp/Fnr family transcriptional regulator [Listeria booriae]|uniref:Crp/Fnr family transcriptional regulator n=1 Tax=Listeria booriae TaxID=1552123 RepID=A0A841Y795_9LIST|nr:Crp/Fnr family transcriptional regulator [Listeria booriae]MBC1370962.1 Crp/Fnr family transcriptional regulator [Listeria booriae]